MRFLSKKITYILICLLLIAAIALTSGCANEVKAVEETTSAPTETETEPPTCTIESTMELKVYDSAKLEINGENTDGFEWSSGNERVASVSQDGTVTAKKAGTAVITARRKGELLSCKVSVISLLIGHRGYSSIYPENTTEAFEAAFEWGFDGIECDVWDCGNELMINHDATTARTSKKKQYIWKINKKNRKKYPVTEVIGADNLGGKKALMPTLEETLKVVAKHKGYLMLHLKTRKGHGFSKKAVKKTVKLLRKYKLTDKALVFVYGKGTIGKFKKYNLKLGAFLTPKNKLGFIKAFNWCQKNRISTLILSKKKIIERYGNTEKLMDLADYLQIDMGVYHSSSHKDYKLYSQAGFEFVMSDYYIR